MKKRNLVLAFCLLPLVFHPHLHHRPGPPGAVCLQAVNGPQLQLRQDEGWAKSVEVDGATRIHQGPRALTLADLRAGQRVHERDRWNGKVYLAEEIDVLPGARADGELLGQSGTHLVLRTREGALVSAQLSADARVHARWWPAQLGSANVGEHTVVSGEILPNGQLLAGEVDFPERNQGLGWLLLPAALAVGGWGWRYGRKRVALF